jgi:uncharacterized protein (DUF488 family)
MPEKTIWTIGHSTRSFAELLSLLQEFKIGLLADIRSFPGSKRLPHFNKGYLEVELPKNQISYLHLKDLGGRRAPRRDSINTGLISGGFRGYADYMETPVFKQSVEKLEQEALRVRTAYMCAEAYWRNCHRALLSDYLKHRGWKVIHIVNASSTEEHSYTRPARIENGQLNYRQPDLFS